MNKHNQTVKIETLDILQRVRFLTTRTTTKNSWHDNAAV